MAVRLVDARDHLEEIAPEACNSNMEAGAVQDMQSKQWYRPMLRHQTSDRARKYRSRLSQCNPLTEILWKQGLPSSGEAVLTYLEQRAAEPCVHSVLSRTRSALAFYGEAAGLPLGQRVSNCRWFCRQADALQSTVLHEERAGLANSLGLPRSFRSVGGERASNTSVEVLRILEVH